MRYNYYRISDYVYNWFVNAGYLSSRTRIEGDFPPKDELGMYKYRQAEFFIDQFKREPKYNFKELKESNCSICYETLNLDDNRQSQVLFDCKRDGQTKFYHKICLSKYIC